MFEEVAFCVEGGRVLDLCCGSGEVVTDALAGGLDIFGLDSRPDRIVLASRVAPGRFQVGDLRSLPFLDESFDWVLCGSDLEELSLQELPVAIAELRRISRKGLWIGVQSGAGSAGSDGRPRNREWWESQFLTHGFRKHPRYYRVSPYGEPGSSGAISIVLRKIPDDVLERYPLEGLLKHRELHMDMSRETGRRSDAHIVRYFHSAKYIRPNDVVLDAACGLGYGTEVLRDNSHAKQLIGIDESDTAIDYASRSFGDPDRRLSFVQGRLPEALANLESGSIDLIVSFETLEHLGQPGTFLAACHRVLSPAGRIVVSVPNDWTDESGRDPNPHHLQVYTWERLQGEIEQHFLLEAAVRQCASRAKVDGKWVPQGRVWQEVSARGFGAEPAEWCLAVGRRSPIDTEGCEFRDGLFEPSLAQFNPLAFARDYANPWIVRGLLRPGSRIVDTELLSEISEQLAGDEDLASVDQGAALCVLGYRLLETPAAWQDVQAYLARVDTWIERAGGDPHEIRWRVSLLFLKGRLLSQAGRRREAIGAYTACGAINACDFSPVLATKTTDAWLRAAELLEASSDIEAAQECRRRAVAVGIECFHAEWPAEFDCESGPPPFFFLEVAQALRNAAVGALHLHYGGEHSRSAFLRETISRRLAVVQKSEPAPPLSGPLDLRLSFAALELRNENPWSRLQTSAENSGFVLHPNVPADGPQPAVVVKGAVLSGRFLVTTAVASNPDSGNPGARLSIALRSDAAVQMGETVFDLPPHQDVPIFVSIPAHGATMDIEVSVLPRTVTSPVECSAVSVAALRLES